MIQNYLTSTVYRYASKWVVLAIDIITVISAFVLSYFIRFNFTFNFDVEKLAIQIPMMAVFSLIAFLITGSFKGVIRHTGIRDVYNIFNAICLSSIIAIFVVLMNRIYGIYDEFTIPLSIIVINSFISFVALTATRYVFKSVHHSMVNKLKSNPKHVLIYGAGESGILTYNALSNHTKSNVKVVGYVDKDKQKIGKNINGIQVYSRQDLTREFIAKKEVAEIIFSIQKIEPRKLRKLIEELVDLNVLVKIVPPVEDWINGELKVSQIKKVQIEDLLDRSPITIHNERIKEELHDKVIMVTGGAGSIGSELVRQIVHYDYKTLIIIDQAESALYELQQELLQQKKHNFVPVVGDIRDKNRMNNLFQEFKPDLIFHAAAYKHVPLMEYNAYEAIKINISGTKVIADLSVHYKVEKFVMISTDKAVNPTNVMGATKRIAEMYISCKQQEGITKFITTRFGNVLGSNGSVIPLFRKQIEKGGPLTVTHKEVTRFFMTIPEASQLVLEAGAMGKGGEIFLFDMGESVKIFDLAKNMIKLSGLQYPHDIDIEITGLRPGEKLYEELLASGENTLPTYHKKIMISKVRDLDYINIRAKIDELCVTNMFFSGNIVRLMKEIVPEYVSQNSSLCEIDKEIESENKAIQKKAESKMI